MPGSLVRKLEQLTPLSEVEKQIAMRAPVRMRHVGARQDIVSDGSQPTDISLISEGFACRYKLLGDGRRQITAFLIPGDICDLRALLIRQMDHGVAALTSSCQIAVIPHQKLLDIIERHPRIGWALWADTMLDAAIYRQWLTNVGRCSAYARIAHLLARSCQPDQGQAMYTPDVTDRYWRRNGSFDGSREPHASAVAFREAYQLAFPCP